MDSQNVYCPGYSRALTRLQLFQGDSRQHLTENHCSTLNVALDIFWTPGKIIVLNTRVLKERKKFLEFRHISHIEIPTYLWLGSWWQGKHTHWNHSAWPGTIVNHLRELFYDRRTSEEYRTSHDQLEEFRNGQKEMPCVLPPPQILLSGIHSSINACSTRKPPESGWWARGNLETNLKWKSGTTKKGHGFWRQTEMPTLAYSSGFSIAGHTLLSTHGLKHARVYTEQADTTQIALKSTHVISENTIQRLSYWIQILRALIKIKIIYNHTA